MTQPPPARRGRPPESFPEVRERDAAVLALLVEKGPMTRNAIAEALGGVKVTLVWNSLDRLRDAGLLRTCASKRRTEIIWSADPEGPCP